MNRSMKKGSALWLCTAGLFMAANIAMSSFGVPVPGGHIYLNDIVIVAAALLLDPVAAFCVGGIGSFLGDLFFYPTPMFVSLVTHGLQAVVIALFVRCFPAKHLKLAAWSGIAVGAAIMVAGYSIGRAFLYATPETALIKLPYQIAQAVVGGLVGGFLGLKLRKITKLNTTGE